MNMVALNMEMFFLIEVKSIELEEMLKLDEESKLEIFVLQF